MAFWQPMLVVLFLVLPVLVECCAPFLCMLGGGERPASLSCPPLPPPGELGPAALAPGLPGLIPPAVWGCRASSSSQAPTPASPANPTPSAHATTPYLCPSACLCSFGPGCARSLSHVMTIRGHLLSQAASPCSIGSSFLLIKFI